MEEQLWSYIDNSSSAEEKIFIENLITTNQAWRNKYQELLGVHQLMSSSLDLEEPSMRFSQNVMEEITRYQISPATKNYINKKIINGIGIFFLVMIIGTIIYGLAQVNWTYSSEPESLLSKYSFSKIEFNKFFSNTFTSIFMVVNVVIGLMLLDMWLTKKKETV